MEPKNILIIDDDIDLANTLKEVIEHVGHKATTAFSSAEGIAAALHEHPDLILLDYRMPNMNGFEIARKIRKDAWGKTAKIILLTAAVSKEDVPDDIGIGEDDFLTKFQWGVENIGKKVEEILAR